MSDIYFTHAESADIIAERIKYGTHWIIIFTPQTHSGCVVRLQNEYFPVNKTGFTACAIPLRINNPSGQNVGTQVLTLCMIDKAVLNATKLADFIRRITGNDVAVSKSALKRSDMLYWVNDKDEADLYMALLKMYLGDRIEM